MGERICRIPVIEPVLPIVGKFADADTQTPFPLVSGWGRVVGWWLAPVGQWGSVRNGVLSTECPKFHLACKTQTDMCIVFLLIK